MLSTETEKNLALLIQAIADNERHIEVKRQIVAENLLFSPYSAFLRLDKFRQGFITVQDLKGFLK